MTTHAVTRASVVFRFIISLRCDAIAASRRILNMVGVAVTSPSFADTVFGVDCEAWKAAGPPAWSTKRRPW
jgi:hypothetical protein